MSYRKILAALTLMATFLGIGTHDLVAQRRLFTHQNLGNYDYKLYHFGFALGFNKMDFSLRPVESLYQLNQNQPLTENIRPMQTVLPRSDFGFHIGIVANLKISPMFDLRFLPTLSFGDRFIDYQFSEAGGLPGSSVTQQFEATFIDFPLHLKYKSVRIGNSRAYLLGGFKFSTDLSSNQHKDESDEGVIYARTLKNDFHYELGFGFDHYFEFFKFSTEIKASFGLRNLIIAGESNPIFTNSIDRLNSKIIMVSFLFE